MRQRLARTLIAICVIFISQFIFIQEAKAASTYPTAPESVAATAGPAALTVTWVEPTDTSTGILNYQVEYSTDGSAWTISSNSISSSTFSYVIPNLTSNAGYFTRVAAKVSAGLGPYAYPWRKLYGTTTANRDGNGNITYQTGYGIAPGDPGNAESTTAFTRVRYKVAANNSGTNTWADMNFAKWATRYDTNTPAGVPFTTPAATVPYLRIPTMATSEQFVIKTNVSDLTVNSSNSALIAFGHVGRLELWPWNYSQGTTSITPNGNGSIYDWDDSPSIGNGNYGSFQIFDLSSVDTHTVFSWSNHAGTPDVGFGNAPSGNPDWTFSVNFNSSIHAISVEIFANFPTKTNFQGIGTVAINTITGAINKRTPKSITANTAGPGFVTFYYNGRKITNCVNVATIANVATCNWKPIITGQQSLTASFASSDGSYTPANSSTLNATTKKR
jgi:hypothetical protein